jgi:hypothetical protein
MAGFIDEMMANLPPSLGEMFQPAPKERWLTPPTEPVSKTAWADKYGGVTPYYPQKRYFEKNLAPEQNVTNFQLEALAQAGQEAVKNGLMTRKQADRMLPTLLTEGATGINPNTGWQYPDTGRYQLILSKAGLPESIPEVNELKTTNRYDRNVIDSKLMHANMAAKIAQYGEDLAYERWNGKGKTSLGADASNHIRKVKELETLLKDPKNKPLMDNWKEYNDRHSSKYPTLSLSESPDNETLGGMHAVNDFKEMLPNSPLPAIQRAVRNWTAPSMSGEEHPHMNMIRDLFKRK